MIHHYLTNKMYNSIRLICLIFAFSGMHILAVSQTDQTRMKISGSVVSETGEPLPGVTIVDPQIQRQQQPTPRHQKDRERDRP